MTRNAVVQAAILIVTACVIGIVANGFASRQRRLVLPGYYPNARKVPPPERVAPPVTATTTVPEAPLVIPPPTVTTTTTVATETTATATQAPVPTATIAAPAAPAPVAVAVVEEDPLKRFPPHPDKAYVELAGDDVAWLYTKGALFLDARRTSVFEQGHIAGARSFSVWESDVDEKVAKLFEERSDPREQNRPIVIYCSGGACEDSHMLAQKLWGVQFNNVYVYKDGFPDWQKRGGAERTGSQP